MLYTIVPPILVIISLIGIIVFLLKKANRVAEIARLENTIGPARYLGSLPAKESADGNGFGSKLKSVLLGLLEKTIRSVRIIFLRLVNVFTSWSESLRDRRRKRSEIATNMESNLEENDVIERINSYNPERKNLGDRMFRRKEVVSGLEEKVVRPLIKESYEKRPIPRVEVKNQLEKVLIERIAANPKDMEAYERLGEYYFEIGNYNHAKECYKQVMKLNPSNIGVRSRMKRLERLLGR